MIRSNLISLCFSFGVILLLASACGPGGNLPATKSVLAPDKDILSLPPCNLPCWQGIIPGKMGKNAIEPLIGHHPYYNKDTVEEYRVGKGKIIAWTYPGEVNRGGAFFVLDDIIQAISLSATSQLALREIIETFGEPEMIQIGDGFLNDHSMGYDVSIFYPKKGLVFHFARVPYLENFRSPIHPTLSLDEVMVFPVGSAQDIVAMANNFRGQTSLTKLYSLPLQKWSGYGDYKFVPE